MELHARRTLQLIFREVTSGGVREGADSRAAS